MSHSGASDRLNKSLSDNTVLNIKCKLAGALLGSAVTDTVGKTTDILDFECLYPFSLFRYGCGTVLRSLGNSTHILDFVRNSIWTIAHFISPLIL